MSQLVKHVGWLSRCDRLWRIPIIENRAWIGPGDELLVGDRLHLDGITTRRMLLLNVVWSQGGWFTDTARTTGASIAPKVCGTYELEGTVHCPGCGRSALHDVTVSADRQHPQAGLRWTFTRHCSCGRSWCQDGTQTQLARTS